MKSGFDSTVMCEVCEKCEALREYYGEQHCKACLQEALKYDDESWFFGNASGMVGDD